MSRNSRLTADVSLEAHNLLRGYAEKHERSKGFLLEKMIRKFCVEVEAAPVAKTELVVVDKKPVKRFVPPMLENIYEYMKEKEVDDIGEANKFNDFYQSNGWKVGKNKMKCWKASVRNWLKGYKSKSTNQNILQDSSNSDWHLKEDTGF